MSSIKPHARFHFPESEWNLAYEQFQMPDLVFDDRQSFLAQSKPPAQAYATEEPDFDLVAERQIDLPRQLLSRDPSSSAPLDERIVAPARKVEFALGVHLPCLY